MLTTGAGHSLFAFWARLAREAWGMFALAVLLMPPVSAQGQPSLMEFEAALDSANFILASEQIAHLGEGLAKTLAQGELALACDRPTEGWATLSRLSLRELPVDLRTRFFLLRGGLQLRSGRPKLAERDFKEALRSAQRGRETALAHQGLVAWAITVHDTEKAREHLTALLELAGQERRATEAAAVLASYETRYHEALLHRRNLALMSGRAEQPATLHWSDRLAVARAMSVLGQSRQAFELYLELLDQALAEGQTYCAFQAATGGLSISVKADDQSRTLTWLQDRMKLFPASEERALLLVSLGYQRGSPDLKLLQQAVYESQAQSRTAQAFAHYRLARALQESEPRTAESHYQKALSAVETFKDEWLLSDVPWALNRVTILRGMADAQRLEGRYEDAEETLDRAGVLALETLGEEERADFFRQRLRWAIKALDLPRATAAWEQLLSDYQKLAPSQQSAAMSLNLRVLHDHFNSWESDQLGYNYLDAADPIERHLSGLTSARVGLVANCLGFFDSQIRAAERTGQSALAAETYLRKSHFLIFLAHWAEAREALDRAKEWAEQSDNREVLQRAFLRGALLEARRGNLDQAIAELGEAVRRSDPRDRFADYNALTQARSLLARGRAAEALGPVEFILSQNPNHIGALQMKAKVLASQGEHTQALAILEDLAPSSSVRRAKFLSLLALARYEEAAEENKALLQERPEPDSPLLRTTYLLDRVSLLRCMAPDSARNALDQAFAELLTVRAGLAPELAAQIFEKSTAGIGLMAETLSLSPERAPDLIRQYGSETLLGALSAEPYRLDVEPLSQYLNPASPSASMKGKSAREALLNTLADLREQDPKLDQLLALRDQELEEVQGTLDSETLFLHPIPLRDLLVVLVISRENMALRVIPISAQRLQELLRDYRLGLGTPTSNIDVLREKGQMVSSFILEPLLKDLQGKTAVRILPSGTFWGFPFESLILENRYMVESYTISYLDAWRSRPTPRPFAGLKLVLGDETNELAGAQAELSLLGKMLGAAVSPKLDLNGLKAVVNKATLVHFATHGLLHEGPAGESGLMVNGLLLTPGVIKTLPLREDSLVVLSACNSAQPISSHLGRASSSLAGAFMTAGAAATIATHWEVDDRFATDFFELFYRKVLSGDSLSVALTNSKRSWLENRRYAHPFYWCPFVLYEMPSRR